MKYKNEIPDSVVEDICSEFMTIACVFAPADRLTSNGEMLHMDQNAVCTHTAVTIPAECLAEFRAACHKFDADFDLYEMTNLSNDNDYCSMVLERGILESYYYYNDSNGLRLVFKRPVADISANPYGDNYEAASVVVHDIKWEHNDDNDTAKVKSVLVDTVLRKTKDKEIDFVDNALILMQVEEMFDSDIDDAKIVRVENYNDKNNDVVDTTGYPVSIINNADLEKTK